MKIHIVRYSIVSQCRSHIWRHRWKFSRAMRSHYWFSECWLNDTSKMNLKSSATSQGPISAVFWAKDRVFNFKHCPLSLRGWLKCWELSFIRLARACVSLNSLISRHYTTGMPGAPHYHGGISSVYLLRVCSHFTGPFSRLIKSLIIVHASVAHNLTLITSCQRVQYTPVSIGFPYSHWRCY